MDRRLAFLASPDNDMTATDYEIIDTEMGEVKQNGAGVAVARVQHGVARRDMVAGLLRPVAAPEEVLAAQNEVRALVAKALTPERDYGIIPGTKKPTLLKPGAERINAAYGVAAEYHVIEKEIDHDRPISFVKRTWEWGKKRGEKIWSETAGQSEGLYRYVVEARLIHRASGVVVGQGIGSCSTMESKYIDRPRDLENTVLKMASKRAYIAATLNTHGLSDQFTQDVEDDPEFSEPAVQPKAKAEPERHVDPWDKPIPFGKDKGKSMGTLSVLHLERIRDWAIDKNADGEFEQFISDVKATIAHLNEVEAEALKTGELTYDSDPAAFAFPEGDDEPGF